MVRERSVRMGIRGEGHVGRGDPWRGRPRGEGRSVRVRQVGRKRKKGGKSVGHLLDEGVYSVRSK